MDSVVWREGRWKRMCWRRGREKMTKHVEGRFSSERTRVEQDGMKVDVCESKDVRGESEA